jgi:hypothetical protein
MNTWNNFTVFAFIYTMHINTLDNGPFLITVPELSLLV